MGRGDRHGGCGWEGPALKPRMWLAESTKTVMHGTQGKPLMQLAGAAQTRQQELICHLQRTVAAQAEWLRSAEQALCRTQGRLGAATRKLKKKEAAAERAERAQVQLAAQLGLCRRELANTAAALREKDAAAKGLLARAGEKEAEAERSERARGQIAERLERALQELAVFRERDTDTQAQLLRASEGEAKAGRAEVAQEHLAVNLERSRQELSATSAQKDPTIEELRARLGEKEAAAERAERPQCVSAPSQAAESAQAPQQELPAAGTLVEKDEQEPLASNKQLLGGAPIRSPRIAPESGEAPAGGQPGCGAARARLQQFVDGVAIGGNPDTTSVRHYDVGSLARFAEERGLSDPEEIIRQHTYWQMERAAAAVCPLDSDPSPAARRSLRTPSPRPEAAAGWRRRLGAPRCASDSSWTDAACSLPASPAAAAAAPAGDGAGRWFAHLPPLAQLPAVGRQLAAAAAEAAAAALPSAGQRRGRPSPAEASGGGGQDSNESADGVLV